MASKFLPQLGSDAIISPPGTYSPTQTGTPIADPGGTYSGYGATATTIDPAGTYSSPYALDRLFIDFGQRTPDNSILSFHSETAVANYYGIHSPQAAEAVGFFSDGYAGTSATMEFTRIGLGQRPHLLGANIDGLTLAQLQAVDGSLSLTFDGYEYSANVDLAGVTSFADAAVLLRTDLNATDSRPVAAETTGSSIAAESVTFQGFYSAGILNVVSTDGPIEVGGFVSGPGVITANSQVIYQHTGDQNGVGTYGNFAFEPDTPLETMTESYGILTVGSVASGAVAVGQSVDGPGILTNTAIDGQLSANTYVVDNAQSWVGKTEMRAPTFTVENQFVLGATVNNDYFEIQPDGYYGFDNDPSSLSFASGTVADELGLTQASGAMDSSPGGQHPSIDKFMSEVLAEGAEFGSFQSNASRVGEADLLKAWTLSGAGMGHDFLGTIMGTSSPAGSSLPVTDPTGTWSNAGASFPTLDGDVLTIHKYLGVSNDSIGHGPG